MKNGLFTFVLAGLFALSNISHASPLTEIIEQAIHQEENVGDLDTAINLYNQVIEKDKANKNVVAQALYRRAQCYYKLGRTAEAEASFRQIVKEFPNQNKTVSLAKRSLKELFSQANSFLPVPWSDNELLRYNLISPAGADLGQIHMETQLTGSKSNGLWRLDSYLSVPLSQTFQFSRINIKQDSFATSDSYIVNSQLGKTLTSYSDQQITAVNIKVSGEASEKTINIESDIYDYDQLTHIGRRLPLHQHYTTEIGLYYSPTGAIANATIKVVGEEKITVPLGTFDTYKVTVNFEKNNNQIPNITAWISKRADRQVVKYESLGNVAVLTEVAEISKDPEIVKDADADVEFTVAQDWLAMNAKDMGNQLSMFYIIFPPKMDGMAMLAAREIDTRAANMSLPLVVESEIKVLQGYFKNYQVREASYAYSVVNGAPALSYIADYIFQENSMIEYRTYIQGATGMYWFVLRAETEAFNSIKNDFDALTTSLVMPKHSTTSKACNNKKHSNLLGNGNFNQGNTHWITYFHNKQPDADITFEDSQQALIRVRDGGKADWHVQLIQEGICLEYTKKYRLSFDYSLASESVDRTFSASVQRMGNGYTNYIFPQTITPTNEIQHFEHDFMMSPETDPNGRVLFNFGGNKIDPTLPESRFSISNVKLIEL